MENAEFVTRDGHPFHSERFNLRPNHFAADSLGHPDDCDGDHNHPPRGEVARS